jgi:hypothetical protein
MEMPIHEFLGRRRSQDITVQGTLVCLGERVVQSLPIAECLMQRRVEAVKEAELELIRALEKVLEFGERQGDVRNFTLRLRSERWGWRSWVAS